MKKVKYSDGKDYSHLKPNSLGIDEDVEDFEEYGLYRVCPMCGGDNITITDEADICHDCGFVYT